MHNLEGLVSNETVLPFPRGSETLKFGFKQVDEGQISPFALTALGLTLEMSACVICLRRTPNA